jgi:serine/threonine protein kinase
MSEEEVEVIVASSSAPPAPLTLTTLEDDAVEEDELEEVIVASNFAPQALTLTTLETCNGCGLDVAADCQFIAFEDMVFHLQCFYCKGDSCGHASLVGKRFGCHEGQMYCEKDFAVVTSEVCEFCSSLILADAVFALGKYFHEDHFRCCVCGGAFASGVFHEHEGQAYCDADYALVVAAKCTGCTKPIMEGNIADIAGMTFHEECVKCCVCACSLLETNGGTQLFTHGEKLFCDRDFQMAFQHRCASCTDYISGPFFTTERGRFCQKCLVCSVCNVTLTEYSFVRGKLVCLEHEEQQEDEVSRNYDPVVCACCGLEVEVEAEDVEAANGPFYYAGKPYHVECMVCAVCATPAATDGLDMKQKPDGSFMCDSCLEVALECTSLWDIMHDFAPGEGSGGAMGAASEHNGLEEKEELDDSLMGRVRHLTRHPVLYEKGKVIGRGANSVVYYGIQRAAGTLLAVKELDVPTNAKGVVKKDIECALREVSVLTSLSHPGVVKYLGAALYSDTAACAVPDAAVAPDPRAEGVEKLALVMEFVPGMSVHDHVRSEGPLSEAVVKVLVCDVLSALAYCHSQRIVHRDIKGKNIMVFRGGTAPDQLCVKLVDFGSACAYSEPTTTDEGAEEEKKRSNQESSSNTTTTGNPEEKSGPGGLAERRSASEEDASEEDAFEGTPLWASPEAIDSIYLPAMDIWSVACVMIEALTGQLPWHEKNFQNNFRALYHISRAQDATPALPADASEDCQAFMRLCFTRAHAQRPTAAQLLEHAWIRS